MYIGEVSKKTGLSIKAIRLYEEKGLIREPLRLGKYRVYQESDIDLLILIKEAKALGVTLSQIKGAIVYKDGDVDWLRVKVFLDEIKLQLLSKIEDLKGKVDRIEECSNQINSQL